MKKRLTGRGEPSMGSCPAPTEERLPDGQHADHWILSDADRAKGFVRPVRRSYVHVGIPGPKYPLLDLTDGQREIWGDRQFAKFEDFESGGGRYWTQEDLDKIGKGCQGATSMPQKIAETYAAQPSFYGSTFCVHCQEYLPVGARGEFVWDDGSRVGT